MSQKADNNKNESGSLLEWLYPLAFFACAGWSVWHAPNYLLDFIPPASESLIDQMSQLALRKDVTPHLPGLFGGFTDFIDWVTLLAMPILFFFGARNVRCASMENPDWRGIDRIALFWSHHYDDDYLYDICDAL